MPASGTPWPFVTLPSIQPVVVATGCPRTGMDRTKWPKNNTSRNRRTLLNNPGRTTHSTRLMDSRIIHRIPRKRKQKKNAILRVGPQFTNHNSLQQLEDHQSPFTAGCKRLHFAAVETPEPSNGEGCSSQCDGPAEVITMARLHKPTIVREL